MHQQTKYLSGGNAPSSEALFSIILGTELRDPYFEGKFSRLLSYGNQGLLNLILLEPQELMSLFGFDEPTVMALKAFVELSTRLTQTVRFRQMTMPDPGSVAAYYMELLCHQTREMVVVAFFDTRSHFITDEVHSIGSHNASIVSAREIFQSALKANADHVILLHNHPSGDPSPSREDREITAQVASAGEIMGVPLADHIIIGDHCYYSFKEKRLLE